MCVNQLMIELFIFTTSDFLFECSKYDEDRESMLFEIKTVCSNFRNLNSQNELIWLFNSENIESLKTLCKFILKHLP